MQEWRRHRLVAWVGVAHLGGGGASAVIFYALRTFPQIPSGWLKQHEDHR
jgi:hypothetical protein